MISSKRSSSRAISFNRPVRGGFLMHFHSVYNNCQGHHGLLRRNPRNQFPGSEDQPAQGLRSRTGKSQVSKLLTIAGSSMSRVSVAQFARNRAIANTPPISRFKNTLSQREKESNIVAIKKRPGDAIVTSNGKPAGTQRNTEPLLLFTISL